MTANECPMAYRGNMTEVVGSMVERVAVPRIKIMDIIFIVPLLEVESPGFHVAGSKMAYFTRFYIESNGTLCNCSSTFYF